MDRVVVGYDGSDAAGHALGEAARFAHCFGASLTIVTAATERLVRSDGIPTMAVDEDAARHVAERGADLARELGIQSVETVTSIDAADRAILGAAGDDCRLIVVGHRSLTPVQQFFLGSTARAVLDQAHCSVLIVR